MDQLDVIVRPATEADIDLLGQYGAQLVAIHHEWDPQRFMAANPKTPAAYSSYLRTQLERGDVVVIVAEVASGVVGYAYAGIEGPDYMALRGPAGVIHDILVEENQRRQGTGRALLAAVVEELRRRGANQIVLSTAYKNVAAQRLFAGSGFAPTMVEMTRQLSETSAD